jgi:5-methylcytosine-specific restriction endonuclease McrA
MIPEKTRKQVMERAAGRCEDCDTEWNYITGPTPELHHLNYNSVGDEACEDLASLCRSCHSARHWHGGEFWDDPELLNSYLEALAKND